MKHFLVLLLVALPRSSEVHLVLLLAIPSLAKVLYQAYLNYMSFLHIRNLII